MVMTRKHTSAREADSEESAPKFDLFVGKTNYWAGVCDTLVAIISAVNEVVMSYGIRWFLRSFCRADS